MDMGLGHVLPTQAMSASCFQLPLISFVDTRDVSGDWRARWLATFGQARWLAYCQSKQVGPAFRNRMSHLGLDRTVEKGPLLGAESSVRRLLRRAS